MFFRELDISLSDIRRIMDNPKFDKREIFETQKFLLEMKRNRLNGMIELISDVLKGEDKMNFEAFNNDDIQKIVNHSLEVMSEEDKKVIIEKYGDIDKFKENVAENLKDEKVGEHLIKIYGSKEKAVEASLQATGYREEFAEQQNETDIIYKQFGCAMENSDENMAMETVARLAENYKSLFRMDNARALLLDVAKEYLNNSQMEEATDRHYGKGITKYIGLAIYRYYEVEEMK